MCKHCRSCFQFVVIARKYVIPTAIGNGSRNTFKNTPEPPSHIAFVTIAWSLSTISAHKERRLSDSGDSQEYRVCRHHDGDECGPDPWSGEPAQAVCYLFVFAATDAIPA